MHYDCMKLISRELLYKQGAIFYRFIVYRFIVGVAAAGEFYKLMFVDANGPSWTLGAYVNNHNKSLAIPLHDRSGLRGLFSPPD